MDTILVVNAGPRSGRGKREELLQATERRLTRLVHAVRRKPAKHDVGVIGLAVGAVIDKHKMKKHFALDIADGHFTLHRRQEEIAAEARLDGIYVIRTSRPADKIGSEAAVAAYKNLALVERAFRTLKGVDLQVRPVHHWLGHRVKAHVFLCMLAYYVEHHIRSALAPILFAGKVRFRAAAAECIESAGKTADLSARATLLSMAQKWLELSDQSIFGQRRLDVALDHFNEGQLQHGNDKPKDLLGTSWALKREPGLGRLADREVEPLHNSGRVPRFGPAGKSRMGHKLRPISAVVVSPATN